MFATVPNRMTLVVGDRGGQAILPVGTGTIACPPRARSAVQYVGSVDALQETAASVDVERIILDRSATAEEFLHLLAKLPPDIAGDVMLIRNDGGAFLSASGRGGDRVLYALAPSDVLFYLQTNGLTGDERHSCTRPS